MTRPPAVARILERVTKTAREHEMFLPGETALIADSGGPDSTCLLHALAELRRLLRIDLAAFHFDHRLRSGSQADAEYVRRSAERLSIPFILRVAETTPEPGESVEDWGHRARMGALALAMREVGASYGALGHTQDDQAETVILALVRGGGLEAISGIRPVQGPFVRPLLDVSRAEVEAFCRAKHLRPRLDPTNTDTRLLRNAVRLKVLPSLERALGRDVRPILARAAGLLRRDAEELERRATEAVVELVEEEPDGVRMPATAVLTLPAAIASRVARSAVYRCGAVPTVDDVDAIIDLAAGRPGRRRHLTGGLVAARDSEYVSLSRTSPESRV